MNKLVNVVLSVTLLVFGNQVFAKSGEMRKPVSPEVKKELLKVFLENERLHSAFFSYDKKSEQIEPLARALSRSIDEISDPSIKKLLKFSQAKLSEISGENKKDENNQRYHLVSMALIHVMNTYDIGDSYSAYSCPMVKMKWVQNSKKVAKVHNPYAPGMPHCGSKESGQ